MRNFKITDEERNSILRLHETSTKKQYLNVIKEAGEQPPVANATLKDVQNILISLGHKVSNNGVADGKLGPLTLNALAAALKSSNPSVGTPQQGQVPGGVNVIDELMKNPEVKAIADKLKAANIDLSKMTPEQILPKVQEIAGDVLTANPNLINTVKTQIETLMKIKLPDLGQPQAGQPQGGQPPVNPVDLANAPEQKGSEVGNAF